MFFKERYGIDRILSFVEILTKIYERRGKWSMIIMKYEARSCETTSKFLFRDLSFFADEISHLLSLAHKSSLI